MMTRFSDLNLITIKNIKDNLDKIFELSETKQNQQNISELASSLFKTMIN
jgi:hypothetical protein